MPRWVNRPEGSNWGDFGDDDQIGRMNLLTPERRRAALLEAREGIAFALSLPLDVPQIPLAPFRQPLCLSAARDAEGDVFHRFAQEALFRQGILLGKLWYLEQLAESLLDRSRHAFLLTAPPLRLPGSVGSPVTPIATVRLMRAGASAIRREAAMEACRKAHAGSVQWGA